MDVTSVNGTPTAKKFGGGGSPACTNPKNLTKWAALIASLVILLHSSSTGVYAARSFGDAISSSDVLVLYKSGSESSRVHKLRSATNTENVEFGHFLGTLSMDSNDVCLIVLAIVGGFLCYKLFPHKVISCLK